MHHFLNTTILLCGAVLAFSACSSDSGFSEEEINASALSVEIDVQGGQEILDALSGDEDRFDQVLDSVEAGDPAWIEIARRLRPYSDAGVSTSLNYAVARALPNAPEHVLALVAKEGFALVDICDSPFIEPEPGIAESYERRALEALATVEDSTLVPLMEPCAERVRLPRDTSTALP